MILLGQNNQANNYFGNLKTAPTITSSGPGSMSFTVNGCWARGAAGKYLFVGYSAGTTVVASLYDDTAQTMTSLTVSGTLGLALANSLSIHITYSATQDKYYLLSNSEKKIYPLTLSGTTLTIGTAIDISATFTGAVATSIVTSDGTDLFVLDVTGLFKKYTLPSGGFGTTLAAPSVTGFDVTSTAYWRIYYANGFIWLIGFASAATSAKVSKIQKYDVSGNTWSTVTVPSALTGWATTEVGFAYIGFHFDKTVSTYFYISTTKYLLKYTVATANLETVLIGGTDAGNTVVTNSTWKTNAVGEYRSDLACDFSRNFAAIFGNGGTEIFNALNFLQTTDYTRITGAGALLGFVAPNWSAYNAAGQPNLNGNILVKYSIDGGAAQYVNLVATNSSDTINKYLPFTTSLDFAFYQPLPLTYAANATVANAVYKLN